MMSIFKKNTVALFFLFASAASTSNAMIAPDVTDNALQNADELLLVTITNVKPTLPYSQNSDTDNGCMHYYEVQANVVDVAQEKYPGDVVVGETVTFQYEYTDTSLSRCVMPGPQNAPLLKRGWCGFVYLNIDTSNSPSGGTTLWEPASYGDSFVSQPKQMCSDPEDYSSQITDFASNGTDGEDGNDNSDNSDNNATDNDNSDNSDGGSRRLLRGLF